MTRIADALPEGPEREAVLRQFGDDADVSALAKGFVETKRMMSSTRRVPGEDASPEDWGSFYNSMGRPEKADGYAIPEDTPAGLKSTLEGLREVAHKNGVTDQMWRSLTEGASENARAQEQQLTDAKSKWEQSIKERYGDKADRNLELANQALEKIMAEDADAANLIRNTGLDKHPALMDMLVKAGEYMGEDSAPVGGSPAETPQNTPNDLYKEAIELMASEPYKNTRHPLAGQAQARFVEIAMTLKQMGYEAGINDPRFTTQAQAFLPDGTRLL